MTDRNSASQNEGIADRALESTVIASGVDVHQDITKEYTIDAPLASCRSASIAQIQTATSCFRCGINRGPSLSL